MVNETRALRMLKSSDALDRNEACEDLRLAESLSQEAMNALAETVTDADPEVADAAREALAIHEGAAQEGSSRSPLNSELQSEMSSAAIAGFVLGAPLGGIAGLIFIGAEYLIARYAIPLPRVEQFITTYWWIPPAGLAAALGTIVSWLLVDHTLHSPPRRT